MADREVSGSEVQGTRQSGTGAERAGRTDSEPRGSSCGPGTERQLCECRGQEEGLRTPVHKDRAGKFLYCDLWGGIEVT